MFFIRATRPANVGDVIGDNSFIAQSPDPGSPTTYLVNVFGEREKHQ